MIHTEQTKKALKLCFEAHEEQLDKSGMPYIFHPFHFAEQMADVPQDTLAELLAADEVHCEVPFCYKDGDDLFHGVIDVLYRKDGKWHIIDYKTNAEAEQLDEKHGNQLDAYIQAVKEIIGEDADAKIYHIGAGGGL